LCESGEVHRAEHGGALSPLLLEARFNTVSGIKDFINGLNVGMQAQMMPTLTSTVDHSSAKLAL
jgi:hypothetical protein